MFQLPRVPTTDQILPLMHQIIDELTQTRNSVLKATTPETATFAIFFPWRRPKMQSKAS